MKAANPLPVMGLFGILLACALLFCLLIPNQKERLARLVQDGKAQRALAVLNSLSEAEVAKNQEFYDLMRLRLSRRLLDPKDQARVLALMDASLRAVERYPANGDYLTELRESISLLDDCAQALQRVAPHFESLPSPARQMLIKSMVRDALSADLPQVAAEAFEHCLLPYPPAESNLVEAIRLWRAAARPDRALLVMENAERQSGSGPSALSAPLAEIKFGLLRELDLNSKAFALAANYIGRNGAGTADQKWVQRMQATVGTPEQRRTLLKACRKIVHENPADGGTWRAIAAISVTMDDRGLAKEALQKLIGLVPGEIAAQEQLARIYEWDGEPSLAFDLYLRLAEQHHTAAIERLIALNPGLRRDKDLLRILRGVGDDIVPNNYRLVLARLLTRHGEYTEAYSVYQKHLKKSPKDAAGMEEYARTLQRQQSFESALAIWKGVQELKPEDEAIRGHIAEGYYLLGDFENSLRAYQQLAGRSTDPAVIRKYCTLAESMGDLQSLSEALTREIELEQQSVPEDFIKLAYVFNLLGADEKRHEVLERGLARFPESDALRIQLSVLLVERREGCRALPVMALSRTLKTDPVAVRLYLDILVECGAYGIAEAFLETGVADKIKEIPSISLLSAIVYEGSRNDAAAERVYQRLYRQHPGDTVHALNYLRILIRLGKSREARTVLQPLLKAPTPEILREASHVYVGLGDYRAAERLQSRIVELPGKTRFQDLSRLGDIRYSAGQRSMARRAYKQALASAEIDLHSQPP